MKGEKTINGDIFLHCGTAGDPFHIPSTRAIDSRVPVWDSSQTCDCGFFFEMEKPVIFNGIFQLLCLYRQ